MSSAQDTNGNPILITAADIMQAGKPSGLMNPAFKNLTDAQKEWVKSVIASFSTLNPLPPYYNIPFPITYFNIFTPYP